ncbi:hypothetical protein Tco_1088818, partial [Tanacetum coccineum]
MAATEAATVKATTELAGSCEDCCVKATAELAGSCGGCCYEGCNETLWLIWRLPHRLKADVKAAIKVAGFYKGCHIVEKAATLLKRLYRGYGLDILHKTNPNRGSYEGRDASTLRLRGGAFYGASTGPSIGPSMGPSTGPSRRRPGGFSELNRGRKRRLHPLGEYVTSGKLCTRVMVTIISGAG